MDLHDSNESSIQVVCLRLLRVENVHRMCAAGDGEDGLGGGMGGRGDGRRVTKEGERKGGERGERRKHLQTVTYSFIEIGRELDSV